MLSVYKDEMFIIVGIERLMKVHFPASKGRDLDDSVIALVLFHLSFLFLTFPSFISFIIPILFLSFYNLLFSFVFLTFYLLLILLFSFPVVTTLSLSLHVLYLHTFPFCYLIISPFLSAVFLFLAYSSLSVFFLLFLMFTLVFLSHVLLLFQFLYLLVGFCFYTRDVSLSFLSYPLL